MKVAFDTHRMRPACPLIAGALGASTDACGHFPSELWLLAPTEEMRVYETSPTQLARLVGLVEESQAAEIVPSEPASSSALRRMQKSWATVGPGKRHSRRALRMDAGER